VRVLWVDNNRERCEDTGRRVIIITSYHFDDRRNKTIVNQAIIWGAVRRHGCATSEPTVKDGQITTFHECERSPVHVDDGGGHRSK
jgi:hypothetical protein